MSWVLGWLFGGGEGSPASGEEPTEPPEPILGAVVRGTPQYVDHVALALDRICQMFKPESTKQ